MMIASLIRKEEKPVRRRWRGRVTRVALVVLALAIIFSIVAQSALANAVTVSKSNYYGYLTYNGVATCYNGWLTDQKIIAPASRVTMAPQYPAAQQVVKSIPRLDVWIPATSTTPGHWLKGYKWGYSTTGVYFPASNDFAFYNQTWQVPERHYYRVATLYRWYRYGVQIGAVTNMYDFGSYFADYNQALRPPLIYNFGPNVPTYCWMPKAGL
jgi:hypothetical protein